MDKVHPAKRGKPAIKNRQGKSQAKYKLAHYRDIQSLSGAIEAAEMRRQGLKLREIRDERRLRLLDEGKDEEFAWMESSNVHRLVAHGNSIIENTAKGLFPIRELPEPKRPKK